MIAHSLESDDQYNTGGEPLYTVLGGEISYEFFVTRLIKEMGSEVLNIHHMATGVAGEGGELLDASKKAWVYGKTLDVTNVIEELGDLEFYMAGMRQMLGLSRRQIIAANIAKLQVRYGDSYSDEAAIARADKELQVIDMSLLQQPPIAPADSGSQTIENLMGGDILQDAPEWLKAALVASAVAPSEVLAWQLRENSNIAYVRVQSGPTSSTLLTFIRPVTSEADQQASHEVASESQELVQPSLEQNSQSSAALPESGEQAAQ